MNWRDDLAEAAAYEARLAGARRSWSQRLLDGEPVTPWDLPAIDFRPPPARDLAFEGIVCAYDDRVFRTFGVPPKHLQRVITEPASAFAIGVDHATEPPACTITLTDADGRTLVLEDARIEMSPDGPGSFTARGASLRGSRWGADCFKAEP